MTPDRPSLPRQTPLSTEPKPDVLPHAVPLHYKAHDVGVEAAAAQFSNALLSYSHHHWERANVMTPYEMQHTYLQFGCPNPLRPRFTTTSLLINGPTPQA